MGSITVEFNVNYFTQFGQVVHISGSAQELGSWDLEDCVRMEWIGDGNWRAQVEFERTTFTTDLSDEELSFDYKYVILHENDPSFRLWEGGADRHIDIAKMKIEPEGIIRLKDTWMTDYGASLKSKIKLNYDSNNPMTFTRIPFQISISGGSGKMTSNRSSSGNLMFLQFSQQHHMSHPHTDILIGSFPQSPEDIKKLESEDVGMILNLQSDDDLKNWNINIHPIIQECESRGIKYTRYPIRDFDTTDLIKKLPGAVKVMQKLLNELAQQISDKREGSSSPKRLYIHCTAGVGRSATVLLAYLYWVRGYKIEIATKHLKELREVRPNADAILRATSEWKALNGMYT